MRSNRSATCDPTNWAVTKWREPRSPSATYVFAPPVTYVFALNTEYRDLWHPATITIAGDQWSARVPADPTRLRNRKIAQDSERHPTKGSKACQGDHKSDKCHGSQTIFSTQTCYAEHRAEVVNDHGDGRNDERRREIAGEHTVPQEPIENGSAEATSHRRQRDPDPPLVAMRGCVIDRLRRRHDVLLGGVVSR